MFGSYVNIDVDPSSAVLNHLTLCALRTLLSTSFDRKCLEMEKLLQPDATSMF